MTKERRKQVMESSPTQRLTTKERLFARRYVKDKNITKSALAVYDTKDPKTASVIGVENLHKPRVRAEIERLLNDNGITKEDILAIHQRNMIQEKHLPTSQKAVESFESMLGLSGTDEKPTTQIAFILHK